MKTISKLITLSAKYKEFDEVVLVYPQGARQLSWYVISKEYFQKKVEESGGYDWMVEHSPPDGEMLTMISREGFDNYLEGIISGGHVEDPRPLLENGNLDLVVHDNRYIDGTLVGLDGEVVPRAHVFKALKKQINFDIFYKLCSDKKIEVLSESKNFIEYKFFATKEDTNKILVREGKFYKPINMFSVGRYLKII